MQPRPIHFEIQVDNPERAIKFYTTVFHWSFQQWGEMKYWMCMTAPKDSKEPGINGGLLPRPALMAEKPCGTNAWVCTVQVDNYDAYAKTILENGGMIALPKMAIPGMAWQGYFLDTEGNTFGLHQADVDAK